MIGSYPHQALTEQASIIDPYIGGQFRGGEIIDATMIIERMSYATLWLRYPLVQNKNVAQQRTRNSEAETSHILEKKYCLGKAISDNGDKNGHPPPHALKIAIRTTRLKLLRTRKTKRLGTYSLSPRRNAGSFEGCSELPTFRKFHKTEIPHKNLLAIPALAFMDWPSATPLSFFPADDAVTVEGKAILVMQRRSRRFPTCMTENVFTAIRNASILSNCVSR